MAGELTQYQYYGLVGQSVSQMGASLTQGFATKSANTVQAGGYGMSAEATELIGEQELINAEADANARMDQFNLTEAANRAITSAMGKTGENTTVSDANQEAAERDTSLMRRKGRMANLSAKSKAIGLRSAAKQSRIAGDAAAITGVLGGVSSAGFGVGSAGLLVGG